MRWLRRLRRRTGLWQRLMLLVFGTVLLMWLALALTSLVFARFQRDFADLAAAQVPRIALTAELSGRSARLTSLATRIIGPEGASDALIDELTAVATGLQDLLGMLHNRTPGDAAGKVAGLRQRVAAVAPLTRHRHDQTEAMARQLEALRWLNVDIQNEVDPLLSDYDFNIRTKMLEIQAAANEAERARLLQQVAADRRLRDNVLQTGIDAGTVVTLLLQAAVAREGRQVEQLGNLGFDMLARLAERTSSLPQGDEFLTLRQSIELLRQAFDSRHGMLAQRQEMLLLETRIYDEISTLQQGLTDLQNELSAISASERAAVQAAIAQGASKARWTMAGLALLTLVLGAAGLMLILGVMRRRLVGPLREVTSRLLLVSEASGTSLRNLPHEDEITRIRRAVDQFARAIGARDEAIAELRQTQSGLVQAGKMAALGNLSAGISHELNQPLSALRYRLVLLESAQRAGNADEVARQLGLAADLCDRMQAIISHLVRFARRADNQRVPVSLSQAVDDAVSLIHSRAEPAGIRPLIGPDIQDQQVLGVAVLIEQVIVNLLTNALDAVSGRPDGTIAVDARYDGKMIELTVTDNGVGLGDLTPEEALNPFVTTKEAGRGMGLGLSISYNIAKDMGGDLALAPAPGQGVVARLRLPAAR